MQQKIPYVFISYVRENSEAVQQLVDDLTKHGIKVWRDRNDIRSGVRWRDTIRQIIQAKTFFIACFSKEYGDEGKTYVNEELVVAIEELRQRPSEPSWFIPVKLCESEVSRAVEIFQYLEWIELFKDWQAGIKSIVTAIDPISARLQELIAALSNPSARVRTRAAEELGDMGQFARKAESLLTQLLNEENKIVRAVAADALGKIKQRTEKEISELLAVMRRGEYYSSKDAAYSLAEFGNPAISALLEAATYSGYGISHHAVGALATVYDLAAVPTLIETLDDHREQVRRSAAEALGRLGKFAKSAIPALIKMDGSESTQALGEIGESSVILNLIERLKSGGYWTRIYAAEALGKIGDTSAVPALLEALTCNEDSVVSTAAHSLLKIGTTEATEKMTPILINNLTHSPPKDADIHAINNSIHIRAGAAELLGQIGGSSFVPLLSELLGEPWTIFKSAAESLVNIGTPEAIKAVTPELIRRLNDDEDSFNRKTATKLLGEIEHSDFDGLY